MQKNNRTIKNVEEAEEAEEAGDTEDTEEETRLVVSEDDRKQFRRTDQFISQKLSLSRSFVKKLTKNNLVTIAGIAIPSLSKMPAADSVISIVIPPPIPCKAQAENIKLDILYEDEHLIFINKPPGLVVHPAPGHYTGTLVNALLYHCKNLGSIGGVQRPGIVHRLDIGTSGVMVAAKSTSAYEELIMLFSSHQIKKIYLALVVPNDNQGKQLLETNKCGRLSGHIGRHPKNRLKMAMIEQRTRGKESISDYRVIKQLEDNLYLLEVSIKTGRTHQIRVHASSLLRAPILMDPLYAHPNQQLQKISSPYLKILKDYAYPLLHSSVLSLPHPISGTLLEFSAPLSPTFQNILDLRNGNRS